MSPQPVPESLDGFHVEQITREEAEPIIMKYEWLGTMNSFPVATYGLRSPSGELHGVACFGRWIKSNVPTAAKLLQQTQQSLSHWSVEPASITHTLTRPLSSLLALAVRCT